MGQLKLLCLVCVYFISEATQINSNEIKMFKATWSKTFNSTKSEPLVLESNNTFIKISCENVSRPPLDLSFIITPIDGSTHCHIPVNENCPRQFRAGILGNGKIIMNERTQDKDYINIVNPKTCSNKTFTLHKPGNLQFLPYFDTFDILTDGDVIYRYNDAGALNSTINKTNLNSGGDKKIFTFKEATPKRTYFLYQSAQDEKSEIIVLNSTFGQTETFHFDHNIGALSAEHNRFGLCYTNLNFYSSDLKCKILDSGIKLLVNAPAIKIDNIRNMAVHNTVDGGAIVVYTVSRSLSTVQVYYSRIHANGTVGDKNILITENGGYDTHVYIREMNAANNEYCIYLLAKVGTEAKAYCNNA